jgi:TPR repeat protein
VLEKLSLFRNDPSLLNASEYIVRTDASPEAFSTFLRFLEGNSISVKSETVNSLRELATEFRFSELVSECDSFDSLRDKVSCGRCFCDNSTIERLLHIEEHQSIVDHRFSIFEGELRIVRERNIFLEREVTRLSTALSLTESRIEGEQQYRRGCEYLYGTNGYGYRGERLSETYGFSLLKQSADLGHSDAQYRIGKCLLDGENCVKDEREGARYVRLSAEAGNSFGQNAFGICLRDGEGVAKDEVRGFELIKRSAAAGNALGQNSLGTSLEDGIGTAKDLRGAIEHYKRSMEQGNSVGQNNYGRCLVNGIGTVANPSEGAAIVKRAADQGNPVAQYNYASYLEEGTGVVQDRAAAAEYYRLAMEGGDSEAKAEYERCLQ